MTATLPQSSPTWPQRRAGAWARLPRVSWSFGSRWWVAVAVVVWGVLAAASVLAADLESAYRAKPSAAVAERLARDWLAKGNAGKAMNWAERMVRSPGATSAQVMWANKLRNDLKWELADAGLGLVILQIAPAHAWVEVDDKLLLPHTGNHAVWLAEGAHTLAVDAPDHTSFEQLITAVRNERQVVTVQLASVKKASLKVVSQPVGELWINGKLVQYTDHPQPVSLAAGSYLVEVRATNYLPWTKSLVLQPGEERTLKVALQRKDEDVARRPAASQVERELTDAERNDRGAVDISRGPAPARDGPAADSTAGGGKSSGGKSGGGSASSSSRPSTAAREPDETAEPTMVEVEREEREEDEPAAPWKPSSTGLVLAVPGLALVGGGLAYAMLGAQAAERVNQEFSPSDANFDAAYSQAAQQTYIGYGVAGLGLVGVGVGSIWLFGKDGLSRTGKGALLTGAGVVGAGLAGWMWWSAQSLATSAGDFVAADPERDRRLSLASRDSLIAYGAGGLGLAAAAVGIYLMATDGGGSTADAALPAGKGLARNRMQSRRAVGLPQVLPWTAAGRGTGGALLRWSF